MSLSAVFILTPSDFVWQVIEEDLIFPCTTLPTESPLSPKLSDLDLSFRSLGYSESSNAMLLDPNSCLTDRKSPSSPLRTMYEGFNIWGWILCLLVSRRDKTRPAGRTAEHSSQALMEEWIATQIPEES